LGTDVTVSPRLRRQADRILLERLPRLALGERIALARIASGGVVVQLRKDPHMRVVRALMENPRLTEGSLLPLLSSSLAAPESLRIIAADRRWGSRYEIRRALVRNRRTPTDVALGLLPSLRKGDLRTLSRTPQCSPEVRRRAKVLLGEEPGSPS
jgi:hypothetical protein